MEATVLTRVVLPIALAIIMLGMGLSLVVEDFRRVLRFPKAFVVGVGAQLVFLPLVGFGVATILNLSPVISVGLVILALCPGGTTSNMFAYLARGDVALSISLTAVVSIITPFTIPLFATLAMRHFVGAEAAVALPLGKTIVTLLAITVVPVAIGMVIRWKAADLAKRFEPVVKILSIVFLVAIIAGIAKQNWGKLPTFFAEAGFASLVLNLATMAMGFGLATLFRLTRKQSITVAIEVGIQNGTTALFITGTILASAGMSIAPAIYSIIMFATGAVVAILASKILKTKG